MNISDKFNGAMAIIEKASPLVAEALDKNSYLILGLLGVMFGCDPLKVDEIRQKIETDLDVFAKLKNLERTHFSWLEVLSTLKMQFKINNED